MKRGGVNRSRIRLAAIVVGAIALASAGPATAADPLAPSKTCRKTIAGEMGKLAKLTAKLIDTCHKNKMKLGASRANCNVIDSVDMDPPKPPAYPTGKYELFKQKAQDKIALKCLAGNPATGNYQSGDAFARLLPIVEAAVVASSVATVGDDTVPNDTQGKADAKCIYSAAKYRTKILDEVLKDTAKNQKLTDNAATPPHVFGRLTDSNLDAGDKQIPVAQLKIPSDCAASTSSYDACTNATSCLTDTVARAQKLARKLYHGNNVCEPLVGARTVEVTISTPETLAGMKLDLDYPQFVSGIVGTEQSENVLSAVTLSDNDPGQFLVVNDRETDMSVVFGSTNAFFPTGGKITIAFDACEPKETNMCNRTQQVIGCAIPTPPFNPAPSVCTFPGSSHLYTEDPPLIVGTPSGCCPGDNACFPQSLSTICSVTDPVRADGTNVSGVTCSVAISGT